MIERFTTPIISKSVNLLAKNRLVHEAINSETAYNLIDGYITRNYIRPLQNPTNNNVLGCAKKLDRFAKSLIPNEKNRVLESRLLGRVIKEFEIAKETGADTNLTKMVKRTLSLMGEKYLRTFLVDFGTVRFGIGKLNKRFQGKPYTEHLSMELSSTCNAKPRCPGCFAEKDEGKLDYETQDRLIAESMALGSILTVIGGGEPLLEKDNLFKLFHKYKRMPFIVATNGILLDEAYAKEVADLENVITLINIPGLESTTTKVRRTPDAWKSIKTAAENLRRFGAASGFASTVFQNNFKDVSSPEFVQQMIDFGMMLGFYFSYTDPVGCSPKTELSLTPQMNEEFFQRIKYVSDNYPLILIDSGRRAEEKIGGCPAGKANFIYVQSNGNVGGCPMVPQVDNQLNVYQMSLRDILLSPYFEFIRKEKPSCLRDPDFQKKLAELTQK